MSVVGVEKVRRKYMAEVSQESDPNASKRPGPGVLEGTRTQARINGIEEKKPLTREEFLKGEFLRQFDKTGTFDRKKATAEANVDLQEQKERMEEERARILEWKYKGGQQKETPMRAEDTVPILERINQQREEGKFNQVDNQQQEKEPIAQTTATEDSSATTEIATPVDADKSEKAEQPADTSKEAKPKTSEVKIGSATWKNKNGDQPVKITGEAGVGADGRRYVHIEGSQAGIPLDEIEYPEKTEGVASAENAEKSSVVEKKTEGEKEITAEVAAEITAEDKAKKKTEETETLNTEKLGKTKEENKIDLESNPDLVKRLEDATLKNGWLTNEQRFIVVRNWYLGKLGYRMKINMAGGEDKYIYKNTGEDKYRKEDRVRDENGKPVKFSLTFWPPKLTAKGEIKPNRRQSHLKFLEREFNKRELNKNEAAAGVVAPTSESAVPEAAAPAEQTPGDIEQQELQTTTDSIFEATLPDADAQDKIFGEATKKTKEHVDKMTEEER
ncbi:MAG: hypothetical protein U1E54_03605, partial [Candidatus Levybacteria bacterium]|nr:hypothetical protein [Candidatus Levybacteria bacterium]